MPAPKLMQVQIVRHISFFFSLVNNMYKDKQESVNIYVTFGTLQGPLEIGTFYL